MSNVAFNAWLDTTRQRVESELTTRLPATTSTLHDAMRYASLNGGKRLRAL